MKSAILITHDKESIANESAALAKAADFNVVYTIKKKFLNKPKYGISDLTELKTSCENLNPDVIIFELGCFIAAKKIAKKPVEPPKKPLCLMHL